MSLFSLKRLRQLWLALLAALALLLAAPLAVASDDPPALATPGTRR